MVTTITNSSSSSSSSPSYTYPPAPSPDIIRSHQKDLHLTTTLSTHLTSLLRSFRGTRFTHVHDITIRTSAELLYYGFTTLIGNRTLGEEYCDIYQVEADGAGRLPAAGRRGGYILSAVVVPYVLGKVMPGLRTRIRARLEGNLAHASNEKKSKIRTKLQSYILTNLTSLTSISTSPILALSLAIFYFNGTYYHLSKRLFGLRYIFSRHLAPSEQRVGYEVLGVLLVVQMAVQAVLHVQNTISTTLPTENTTTTTDESDVEIPLPSHELPTPNTHPEPPTSATSSLHRISTTTHTPLPPPTSPPSTTPNPPRYDLSSPSTLSWLQPAQQRKCTLCLEPMKDPSVTTCGHVFCWTCILGWVEEKPECPLCRQGVLGQHVLVLRG